MAYTFTTIAFPSDTFTQALCINSTDTIVGFHGATTNLAYSLVLPATFTPISTPANLLTIPPPSIPLVPTQTDAVGINDAQQIVGFVTDNQTPAVTRGFIDNGGVFSLVVAPGTAFNQLLGDNNVGQDVGYSSLDVTGATLQLAYIYQQTTGTFTYLDNATHTGTCRPTSTVKRPGSTMPVMSSASICRQPRHRMASSSRAGQPLQ
jgi:hypothetical protein